MGVVIDAGAGRFGASGADHRPPRRVTDPRDRAPVVLQESAPYLGAALILPGRPEQATVMRRHLRMIVGTQKRELPVVEFLASELFNNCVLHSRSGQPGGEVTVAVIKLPGRVQVKVIDQGPLPDRPTTPHGRPLDPQRENGFGLALVAADASRWGTFHEDGRTTVWFEIDRTSART